MTSDSPGTGLITKLQLVVEQEQKPLSLLGVAGQ